MLQKFSLVLGQGNKSLQNNILLKMVFTIRAWFSISTETVNLSDLSGRK